MSVKTNDKHIWGDKVITGDGIMLFNEVGLCTNLDELGATQEVLLEKHSTWLVNADLFPVDEVKTETEAKSPADNSAGDSSDKPSTDRPPDEKYLEIMEELMDDDDAEFTEEGRFDMLYLNACLESAGLPAITPSERDDLMDQVHSEDGSE